MNAVPVVQSDTTRIEPALVGIIISADGTLKYENDKGDDITFVAPAAADGGCYPFHLQGRIRRIYDTGTDIGNADLTGLALS